MNDQNDGQHLAPTGGEAPEVGQRTETGDEAAPYRQSLRFPSGLALRELVALHRKDGAALNPHLGGAARLGVVYGALLAVGLSL